MAEPSTSEAPLRMMLLGGIGSGKSTVGRMLGELGALVIDADLVGHEVLEPGGAAFDSVVRRWPSVLADGAGGRVIDRKALARIVFDDVDELRVLEAMTHPAIATEIRRRVDEAPFRHVVVEVPLTKRLLGPGWIRVLVDAPDEVRTKRVIARGSAPRDVARRMAAQPTRSEWRSAADFVVENDGTVEDLRRRVEELWRRLLEGGERGAGARYRSG